MDRRTDQGGHRPGSTAIRLVVFPASEGIQCYRISVQDLLESSQPAHIRMMTTKRSKVNPDPSLAAALDVIGIPAAGHGDRGGLPDSADAGDSHCAADEVELGYGSSSCNSVVRDHNAGRDRTSTGIHCADKPAAAEQLRHEPPSALAGRARQRLWLRGTLEQFHVRCLPKAATRGIPTLPTSGFLLQIPPRRHNTQPSTNRMTTGQMTCASGADDVFLNPVQKTSFSDDRQHLTALPSNSLASVTHAALGSVKMLDVPYHQR